VASALLPDNSTITYLLTGLDYTAETINFSGNRVHVVRALGIGAALPALTADTGSSQVTVELYNCVAGGFTATGAGGVVLRTKNPFGGTYLIGDIDVSGAADAATLDFWNSYVRNIAGSASPIGSGGTTLECKGGAVDAATVVVANFAFDDTQIIGDPEVGANWTVDTGGTIKNCTTFASAGLVITSIGTSAILAFDDVSFNQFITGGLGSLVGNWAFQHLDAIQTQYTPVLGSLNADATIGDGAMQGSWLLIGDTLQMRVIVEQGTTTNFGTGNTTFTMPDQWDIAAPADAVGTTNATITDSSGTVGVVKPLGLNPGGLLEFNINFSSLGLPASTTVIIEFSTRVQRTVTP